MDFGFRERPGHGFKERLAELEDMFWEAASEESRLGFFILGSGGQYVIGVPRGFRHGDIDHDHAIQGVEGFPHPRAIGQGVHRISTLDDHASETIRVIGQDFIGDHVAGNQSRDDPMAADGRLSVVASRSDQFAEMGPDVHGAGAAKVAREDVEQLFEIRVQCTVRGHLDPKVFEYGHAGCSPNPSRGSPGVFRVDAGSLAVRGDVNLLENRLEVTKGFRVDIDKAMVRQVFLD